MAGSGVGVGEKYVAPESVTYVAPGVSTSTKKLDVLSYRANWVDEPTATFAVANRLKINCASTERLEPTVE